jgi:dihydrofolate synthase/folylpolyglutamate synthase
MTPISLEHTQILGNTLRRIAREKSFLIHSERPVVMAKQEKEAKKVLLARARAMRTPLFEEGKNFVTSRPSLTLNRAPYLLQNFSLVLMALKILKSGCGFSKISLKKASQTFQKKNWPGRFEIVNHKPLVLIDGAHNPASAKELVKAVKLLYPRKKIVLLSAIARDKDTEGILREFSALKPKLFIATQFKNTRSLPTDTLLGLAEKYFPFRVGTDSAKTAVGLLKRFLNPKSMLLGAGSLYLAAEMRELYGKTHI